MNQLVNTFHNELSVSRDKKSVVDTILLIGCLLWLLVSRIYRFNIAYAQFEVFVGLCIIAWTFSEIRKIRLHYLLLFTTLCMFVSSNISGNIFWNQHFISLFFMLPISVLIARKKYYDNILTYYCILVFVYLIFNIDFVLGSFYDVSRNFISSYVLLCLFPIFLIKSNQPNSFRTILLLSLLGFFVAVVSIGRGGILSLSILVLAIVLFNVKSSVQSRSKKFGAILLVFVFIVIIIYIMNNQDLQHALFGRFIDRLESGDEEARSFIYADYFYDFTISDFFFGKNLDSCPMIVHYNHNTHNSILSVHCKYGIIGVLFLLYLFYTCVRKYFTSKNYIMVAFMLSVMLRLSTDTLIAQGLFDIIVISIYIMFLRNKYEDEFEGYIY